MGCPEEPPGTRGQGDPSYWVGLEAPGQQLLRAGSLCVSGVALLTASGRRGMHALPSPGPARDSSWLTGLTRPSSYVWGSRPARVCPVKLPGGRLSVLSAVWESVVCPSRPGVSGSGDGAVQ